MQRHLPALTLSFNPQQRHTDTTLISINPIEIVTPSPQWSYGAWLLCDASIADSDEERVLTVTARVEVRAGRAGIGWTRARQDDFIIERYVTGPEPQAITLRIPVAATPGRLIFRNASDSGPTHLVIHDVRATAEAAPPYPGMVHHRELLDFDVDDAPLVFEDDLARSINQARLDFLGSLNLSLHGKRVLDAGCGVGHHTLFYTNAGADVVGMDGRASNIAAMARLYPTVTGVVADVQNADLASLGLFDIVHCFGLVYHLDSPVAALRRLAQVCREQLIVETLVCDASAPVLVLVDEPGSANQALAGLGCRPSPSFITMALDRIGFPHVYGTTAPPRHPDFVCEWRNSFDISRDGHNLRCVWVASRVPLACPHLVDLVSRE